MAAATLAFSREKPRGQNCNIDAPCVGAGTESAGLICESKGKTTACFLPLSWTALFPVTYHQARDVPSGGLCDSATDTVLRPARTNAYAPHTQDGDLIRGGSAPPTKLTATECRPARYIAQDERLVWKLRQQYPIRRQTDALAHSGGVS